MPKVWLNGRLTDGPISLDPSDRGLLLGDGVFETLAVFNGKPAYLKAHLDRLEQGAKTLAIAVSREVIENGAAELLAGHRGENGILRLTVTRGPAPRGLAASSPHPTVLITLSPWPKGALHAPVRLVTSSLRRNEHSPASRLKTLSYVDNILAAREASLAGADDALLLNTAGRIACSTISNLFAIRGSTLVTPPVTEGVLPGIIRARLLTLAGKIGLDAQEVPLNAAELLAADGGFLTNSLRLIRPVAAVDGETLSPITADLLKSLSTVLYEEIAEETGGDPRQIDGANL
jgi:branched-chain amino acid aminotransferase